LLCEYALTLNEYTHALNEVLLAFLSVTCTHTNKYTLAEIQLPRFPLGNYVHVCFSLNVHQVFQSTGHIQ